MTEQAWYQGGYRANVVAYALGKLAYDVERLGLALNFDRIWRLQAPTPHLLAALSCASKDVHDVIVDPPAMVRNVTEWAKQQACWNRIKGLEVKWPKAWLAELGTGEDQQEERRFAKKEQRVLNGIEAQSIVVNAGGDFWKAALDRASRRKILTEMESGILTVAAAIPMRLPSEKQSVRALDALRKMHVDGYQNGKELV